MSRVEMLAEKIFQVPAERPANWPRFRMSLDLIVKLGVNDRSESLFELMYEETERFAEQLTFATKKYFMIREARIRCALKTPLSKSDKIKLRKIRESKIADVRAAASAEAAKAAWEAASNDG